MATFLDTALETGSFQNQQARETTLTMTTSKRRSYSREKKLKILKYYHENGQNKYQTFQKFGIGKGCLYRWIKKEKQIFDGSKDSKQVEGGGRIPFWPDVEEKLVGKFNELRAKGLKVKHYWFRTQAVQLMSELHPDVDFKFSPGWFDRFKARNNLSYRRSTNVAQTKPTDMEDKIRAFHLENRRVAALKDSVEPWASSSCALSPMWIRHHFLSLSIVGRATTKRETRQFGIAVQPLVLTSTNALCN